MGWLGVTGDLDKSQASLALGGRDGAGGSGDRGWRPLCDTLAILTAEGGGEGGQWSCAAVGGAKARGEAHR